MTSKKEELQLESEIQREICDWLHENKFFFWRQNNVPVFARSNDGKMRYRALPKYTPKGLPDIMLVYRGVFFGIEVKRPGCKLTPEQKVFALALRSQGGFYLMADSVSQVQQFFGQKQAEADPLESVRLSIES